MGKGRPTLAELIEAEMGKAVPNPFVQSCAEQVMKMKPLVESVPARHQLEAHSQCVAALLILQADPTHPNLQAARAAVEAYEDADFCN